MARTGAYQVEDAFYTGHRARLFVRPEGMALADQNELIQRLADHFEPSRYRVTVLRAQGRPSSRSTAWASKRLIRMGALAGPALCAHEYAHILAEPAIVADMAARGSKRRQSHGEIWQRTYVECVRFLLGEYVADDLDDAFADLRNEQFERRSTARRKVTA